MLKNNKKIFIKEALGSRNYFSYRADLFLYKMLLCISVLIVLLFISDDWKLSVLIAGEAFLIFTLVNKLNVARKQNEGERKLIARMKKEHFKKKIDEINPKDFEMLVGFLFEKKGYKNFVKKGHMFLAEKEGIISCIKIYRLYDEVELEKIDVRNLVTFMLQNNVKNGYLITTGCLSEEAIKLNEKFKDKLNIEVVDLDALFEMMEDYDILPDNSYFYAKVGESNKVESKEKIKNNAFDKKKIIVYILAAVFFYAFSVLLPDNNISLYISLYFILLTAGNLLHMYWRIYLKS